MPTEGAYRKISTTNVHPTFLVGLYLCVSDLRVNIFHQLSDVKKPFISWGFPGKIITLISSSLITSEKKSYSMNHTSPATLVTKRMEQ